jgi:uncharacterized protein YkwD
MDRVGGKNAATGVFAPSSPLAARNKKGCRLGKTALLNASTIIIAVLLASIAVVGLSATAPEDAQASTGGKVRKCGGGKVFLGAKEKRVFYLHNKTRREHHLKAFCVHPKLKQAARFHSKDMIHRDYFSHNTKGRHETFAKRLKRFGYTPRGYDFYMVGENIGWGTGEQGKPDRIFEGWMKSRPHRRTILKGKLREIGVGAYTGTFKDRGTATMYTVDFGVRRR